MVLLGNPRYSCLLVVQLLLLGVDIFCNSFAILLASSNISLLVVCIVQDIALLSAQVTLFLAFFNTFAFTAGLFRVLLKKFAWAIAVGGIYLLVTVAYHIWLVATRWNRPSEYTWTGWLQAMYAAQKLLAIFYYYIHKRAAYRLSDPRYYSEPEWMGNHMRR